MFASQKHTHKVDDKRAINKTKNLVQQSRTRKIEVHHHFISYHVEKGNVILQCVPTDLQLADTFTKSFIEDYFNFICQGLGMLNLDA